MSDTAEKKPLSKDIKIHISGNDYVVKFPDNGKLIEMERMKHALTKGTAGDMISGDLSSNLALATAYTIATFTVLIPQLNKDLAVKSLLDLDPIQFKPVLKEYYRFNKWWSEWVDEINKEFEEDDQIER